MSAHIIQLSYLFLHFGYFSDFLAVLFYFSVTRLVIFVFITILSSHDDDDDGIIIIVVVIIIIIICYQIY